jgi:hypothetical protein
MASVAKIWTKRGRWQLSTQFGKEFRNKRIHQIFFGATNVEKAKPRRSEMISMLVNSLVDES